VTTQTATVLDSPTTLRENHPVPSAILIAALEASYQGLILFDEHLRLLHATAGFWNLMGTSHGSSELPQEIAQALSGSALHKDAIASALKQIQEACEGRPQQHSLILTTRETEPNLLLEVSKLASGYYLATFQEERKSGGAGGSVQLESLNRDSLTRIPNRAYFEANVNQALLQSPLAALAVMLVDLDRFKTVNDTLGHAAGDTLLRLAAERLQVAVRAGDVVARFGGDEFAVLLNPSSTIEEPSQIAKRILELLQKTYMIEGQLVNVGASIGIAQSPRDGNDCKTLLKHADLALYQSKEMGRAMFQFFNPGMQERASERRANELELRQALALRQLELHYQPQVETPAGRLVGFEALIRWRHPTKGLLPPGMFLPLAEEIGVIVPIGDWVLRTACREAMRWPDEITIAVNASPLQFDAGNFAVSVQQALRATGLPGRRLEIEITEGIFLRNDTAILETLHELRAMNVRIAMDDFGTGYASLSQLARFPFDKIKIDRSLAGFDGDDLKQRAIVRAITALGQSLGVCTLAEGVENKEQLARLEADGCASVQGYFFGRPVPADQLDEVISRLCPQEATHK